MTRPDIARRRRLKVRHLELLAALGEGATVHRAARALGITQPAASKLLHETEIELGTRLFERTRRGVMPTAAGAAMVARARRLLGVLDSAHDELAAIETGATGLVRVGVYAVAAPVLVPSAIAWLHARQARVRVRVEEGGPDALLGGLRQGTLDCVIGRVLDDDDTAAFDVESLYPEPIVIAVRPDHRFARARRIDWAAAVAGEWILPHPNAPLRRMFAAWLARHGLREPRILLESVSIPANVTLIRETDAMVMLPGRVAAHYEALHLVKVLPLPFTATLPPVSLLRRRGETADAALASFCDALRAVRPGLGAARR